MRRHCFLTSPHKIQIQSKHQRNESKRIEIVWCMWQCLPEKYLKSFPTMQTWILNLALDCNCFRICHMKWRVSLALLCGWNVEPNGISSKFYAEIRMKCEECVRWLLLFALFFGLISKYDIKSHIPRPNKWHWNIYTLFTWMPFTFCCERNTHIFTVWVFLISKLVGSVILFESFERITVEMKSFAYDETQLKWRYSFSAATKGRNSMKKREQISPTC